MKHKIYSLLLITLLTLSCSEGKFEKNHIVKDKEVHDEERGAINVILNNDATDSDTIKGNIKYYFKVRDSLKLLSEDERKIFLAVAVKPDNDLEFKIDEDDFFTQNIDLQLKKDNDTMFIPFSLAKQFRGKAVIFGIITDAFILKHPDYTDNPELVRMLSAQFEFDESVHLE